jgi:SAM-dependent methyltransferase
MSKVNIEYEKVHTVSKRTMLDGLFQEVTEEMHRVYPPAAVSSACLLCSSLSIYLYVEKYGYRMFRCADCGLLFCNPYPSKQSLAFFYNSKYKDFENSYFAESRSERLKIFRPRAQLVLDLLPANGRILDVGGAIGLFVDALFELASDVPVTVSDLSHDALRLLALRHPAVKQIAGDFMDIPCYSPYQIVTMWDTLEHLVDPNFSLQRIHALLAEGGHFIFSTPNTTGLEWVVKQEKHVQILPPGHVNLFNVGNIAELLQRNGFSVLQILTPNPDLDISYLLSTHSPSSVSPVEGFLLHFLQDVGVRDSMTDYLRRQCMGGNMVVISQRCK